jgi:MFS family permease
MTTTRRLLPISGALFVSMGALALVGVPAQVETALLLVLGLLAAAALRVGTREIVEQVNALPEPEAAQPLHRVVGAWGERTFSALGDRHFRMLYFGNVLQFGSMQMQLVVRGYLVFHITGSFAALGTMALANALPALVASPIGGVVADRATKKTVIQIAQAYNLVNALLLAIIAAGWFGLELQFWHLFASSFLQGVVNSIMQPSRQSMISELVPRERLMNAIGINSSGQTFMQLVGPGMAGFLIAAVSPSMVFAVNAGFYVLAILCTTQLPAKPLYASARPMRRGGGGAGDLVAGMRYVITNAVLRNVMLINFFIVIAAMPYQQLLPGFVASVLHRGPFEQGMLQSVQGLGALGGAVFVASSGSTWRGRKLMGFGAMMGLAILVFSTSSIYWLSLPVMVFLGFAQATRMSLGQVLIQEYSADEYRGRVSSIFFMQFGLVQFGTFIVGMLAAAVGPQLAMGGMAALLLTAMTLGVILNPTIRELQ